jgi:hypothetical protein
MGISQSTPLPPAESTPALSQVERITNVFFAPSSTFTDVKSSPSWWAPWLLMSVFALVSVFAMQQKIGWPQMVENEINASPKQAEQLEKLPPEQRAQRIAVAATFTRYISYATPVVILVLMVIVAAVMMGTFNFGLGTEMSFATALAVVMYSYLPWIVRSLLAAVSLYAGANPEGFNSRNPVASNLGFLVSRADHPVLYVLGSSVDVFGIWIVILLGIGFSCVSKAKRSTAISVVAGWYVLISLLGAGWIAIFS